MRPDVYRTVHADERNAIGRFHMPKKDLHGGGGVVVVVVGCATFVKNWTVAMVRC